MKSKNDMGRGVIYLYNEATDDEEEIEHRNAYDLSAGFYIVQDFKQIKKPTAESIKKLLADGKHVHKASAYGGHEALFFTGRVIWSNHEFYETSSFAGEATSLGKVPAGTLIVNVDDD